MIFRTPKLHRSALILLREIDSIRGKLRHSTSQPRRWAGVLRRNTFARAIRGSNSIEGYNVTQEDALAAVDGEEPLNAQRETWAAVSGYRNAMTYVLQLAGDPHFAYSDGLIRSLHFMMLHYDLAKHPGSWRSGSIYVRDEKTGATVYEGPHVDSVPKLMAEAIADLREVSNETPAMVKAAMGHLNLVMIHPFADGNGRMARCLQTMILSREGIVDPRFSSIEEYLGRNTQDCYNVLEQVGGGSWHPKNDARPWVDFCLVAHFNQATTILRRSRELERLWNELEKIIQTKALPERVIFALSDAAFGYKVRNSTYRVPADVSDTLASRDLKMLVDKGLLMPDGEKRGRVYVGSPALRLIREQTREPKPAYKSISSLDL